MDVAGVYRGPLDDFIPRRTALARQVRPGDPDAAARVAKLRKPPVSVWAIDQLAAEKSDLITELLAAGADAKAAQHNAAGGAANAETLIDASARVRDLVEAGVRSAASVLNASGHAGGDDTLRRIRTTLQAAITGTPSERQALWNGTLDRDLERSGFGSAEDLEDDAPELAAAIAPLRQAPSPKRARAAPDRGGRGADIATRRAAGRSAAESERSAERARAIAATKRENADRLAEEARRSAADAAAAEAAADAAEEVARELRALLSEQPTQ